jgi:hypothetical protein
VVIPKGTKAGEVLDVPIPDPEENETAEGGKDAGVGIVFAPGQLNIHRAIGCRGLGGKATCLGRERGFRGVFNAANAIIECNCACGALATPLLS